MSGTLVRGGSLYIGSHWQELQIYIRKCVRDGYMMCVHSSQPMFDMVIEPLPSTMIDALDIPELPLEHSTNDWLFSDVTL